MDAELCAECVSKNKDMIVGLKVRLSASAANDGANEEEAFRYVFFYFLVRNETLQLSSFPNWLFICIQRSIITNTSWPDLSYKILAENSGKTLYLGHTLCCFVVQDN